MSDPGWPLGGGEMSDRIRRHDWAETPLGPIAGWPARLRFAVEFVLATPYPAAVYWGPDLLQIYNDPQIPVCGRRHPAKFGCPLIEAWPEIADRIVRARDALFSSGEPLAFADLRFDLLGLDGSLRPAWFSGAWTPIRDDDGTVLGAVATCIESTARVLSDGALRRSEERQAYLLGLSDAIRPLSDALAIEQEASRLLREQLGADRVAYFEAIDEETLSHATAESADPKLPPFLGRRFRFADYEPRGRDFFRDGRPAGRDDVLLAEDYHENHRAIWARAGARAYLFMPMLKSGRLVAGLAAYFARPHAWSAADRELLEATAERTWSAVLRARAEAALRESESRFRLFADASDDVIWIRESRTLKFVFAGAGFTRAFGAANQSILKSAPVDDFLRLVHPEDRGAVRDTVDRALAGERVSYLMRILRHPDGEVRWIHSNVFPLRDASGRITHIGGIGRDVTDARRAEERMKVLVAELQHRTRNLLAVVRSIAEQTLAAAGPTPQFQEQFGARLASLGRVQDLLSHTRKAPITIEALVRMELDALAPPEAFAERIAIEGPAVHIRDSVVQALALALHELATNARKYGALSDREGWLGVTWSLRETEGGAPRLLLKWVEKVAIPDGAAQGAASAGYGRRLIERALPYSLNAETSYAIDDNGIRCTIDLPLDDGEAPGRTP